MTDTATDITATVDGDVAADRPDASMAHDGAPADRAGTGASPLCANDPANPACARRMIAVDKLNAHPGNVREDLDLTPEFCASIAETASGCHGSSPSMSRAATGDRRPPPTLGLGQGRADRGALRPGRRPRQG